MTEEKVYCKDCHYYPLESDFVILYCNYVKRTYIVDTPIRQRQLTDFACVQIDNKDNNCFYFTPRQNKRKKPTHILEKIIYFILRK